MPDSKTLIHWQEDGQTRSAQWRSEAGIAPHDRVEVIDDRVSADEAYRRMDGGVALLWRGDWVNARHLMQALARRADRRFGSERGKLPATPAEAFARHRARQGQRAALLARLLVPLTADYQIPLRRAQDVSDACQAAWGAQGDADACDGRENHDSGDRLIALRELLAVVSAWEWRKKGVPVPQIQGRIYPHYGVFSPVRGEYVDLVARAPLPDPCATAFDIGVGSGILSAVLARRSVPRIVATDQDARALACATENLHQLGLAAQVEVIRADLFPEGRADLVVCNPPWLPAQPSSSVEYAVYDPDSRMLKGFLNGLAAHLNPGGEGWLIISDIAERLGLRSRDELLGWIAAAGLKVAERIDTRPSHPKSRDASDPLHEARAGEVTSLWRLQATA